MNYSKFKIGKVYTGKEFNELNKQPLYKFTNEDEEHFGFKYQTGLNVDTSEFSPFGRCRKGGLYFCDLIGAKTWKGHNTYVREVVIPDSAKVYVENDDKYKADMIYLSERTLIEDYVISDNYYYMVYNLLDEFAEKFSKSKGLPDGMAVLMKLSFIRNIVNDYDTDKLIKFASVTPHILEHIDDQTYDTYLQIVKNYGPSIKFIKKEYHTEEMYLEAVKNEGWSIQFVDENDRTEELCLEVVKKYGSALQYVVNQTDEMCLIAVNHTHHNLQYVNNMTAEIFLTALRKDSGAMAYLKPDNDVHIDIYDNYRKDIEDIFRTCHPDKYHKFKQYESKYDYYMNVEGFIPCLTLSYSNDPFNPIHMKNVIVNNNHNYGYNYY